MMMYLESIVFKCQVHTLAFDTLYWLYW